jgi:hypothetical protein
MKKKIPVIYLIRIEDTSLRLQLYDELVVELGNAVRYVPIFNRIGEQTAEIPIEKIL